jgi:hypothetical protein
MLFPVGVRIKRGIYVFAGRAGQVFYLSLTREQGLSISCLGLRSANETPPQLIKYFITTIPSGGGWDAAGANKRKAPEDDHTRGDFAVGWSKQDRMPMLL